MSLRSLSDKSLRSRIQQLTRRERSITLLVLLHLNELERRRADVGYVKTEDGSEIDFLARYLGAGEELIQVCADLSDQATLTRELRALDATRKDYPHASRHLLVLDRDIVPRTEMPGVTVQPAYEWMLGSENVSE